MAKKWQKSVTVQDFFALPTFYFELMGTWTTKFHNYLPSPIKFIGPYMGNVFRVFVFLVMIHLEIVLYVTTVDKFTNTGFDESFIFFLNLVIYFWICCIITFYGTQERKIKELFKVMNCEFRQRSAPGLTYVTVEPGFTMASKMLNYWQWSCVFVGASYALIPLVNGSRQLPIPTWYPVDVQEWYETLYAFQFFAQTWIAFIFANAMGFCFYVFILFGSQLDILCASIKNVPYTALIKHGMEKRILLKLQDNIKNTHQEINQYSMGDDIELLEDFDVYNQKSNNTKLFFNYELSQDTFSNTDVTRHVKAALLDCIRHHQTIMQLCKNFDKEMNVFVLAKIADINLLLTVILFAVTVTKDTATIIVYLEYLTIPLLELLFLSYSGHILTSQSARIINAFMNSPWHLYMVPVRKELSIMLARAVQPFYLTAGGMFNISIATLIAVLKASFSYYTLLAKLNRKH